jgi:hypothetical protein
VPPKPYTEGAHVITTADLQKSDDDLLIELAEQLVTSGHIRLSGPLDERGKREHARLWLDAFLSGLRLSICTDPRIVAYLQDENLQNHVEAAAVVVDCLSPANLGFPLGTLSLLIVKGRLRKLCG